MTAESNSKQHIQKHILVADDELHTQFGASLILKKAGFQVTTVGSGKQVLKQFESKKNIDALVIDFQLADMTGMEVIKQLLERKIFIPVLIISGYEIRDVLTENLCQGGVFVLEKPFEPDALIESVSQMIELIARLPLRGEKESAEVAS